MKLTAKRPRQAKKTKSVPKPALPFVQQRTPGRIEFIDRPVPHVYVSRDAYSRMYHLVDIAHEEVGWLGTVKMTRLGNFVIEEVFLLEQEVTSAQTELSTEGQAKLVQHLIETRSDGMDVANRLRFWGHSHVNMSTDPSYQDNRQMDELRDSGCPWFIRGILNKQGVMRFDIFFWDSGVKVIDAAWSIWDQIDDSMRAELETEFNDKVSRKVYPTHTVVSSWKGGPQPAHPGYTGEISGNRTGRIVVLDPTMMHAGETSSVG